MSQLNVWIIQEHLLLLICSFILFVCLLLFVLFRSASQTFCWLKCKTVARRNAQPESTVYCHYVRSHKSLPPSLSFSLEEMGSIIASIIICGFWIKVHIYLLLALLLLLILLSFIAFYIKFLISWFICRIPFNYL